MLIKLWSLYLHTPLRQISLLVKKCLISAFHPFLIRHSLHWEMWTGEKNWECTDLKHWTLPLFNESSITFFRVSKIWSGNVPYWFRSVLLSIYHCYQVNDCSSKILVIRGDVHLLRHCQPFSMKKHFAYKRRNVFFFSTKILSTFCK